MATGRLPDPNTAPVTAKGDLYTYSTVPAKLAVGSNGETLVADSSASTGLRYSAGVGFTQPIINGGMDVWQRGTSFSIAASTSASSSTYLADRWQTFTNANQAITVSRQTTSDTTNLPFIQYALRYQRNSGQTGTGILYLGQSLENVNSTPFIGKTVTVSFYARAGANYSASSSNLAGGLYSGTGTDQNALVSFTGSTNAVPISATLTTTWQRFSYSGTISSSATQLGLLFAFTPVGTASTNDWYEVTGVQIDVGSTALPFRRSGGTLAGELAACQRYYYRATAGANYAMMAHGQASSATLAAIAVRLPVTMRSAPTVVDYSTLRLSDESAGYAVTNLTVNTNCYSKDIPVVDATVASGLTAQRYFSLQANNSTSAYLGLAAEL